jgi:hypothetical protein
MPKTTTEDFTEIPDRFEVKFEQQKLFNKSTGEWELLPLYATPQYIKYHETMAVQDGRAATEDIEVAMELVDVPTVKVTPDPRPYFQERHARVLQEEVEGAPWRAWELWKYVTETNEWRAQRQLPPLTVTAERVARPPSALVQGANVQG